MENKMKKSFVYSLFAAALAVSGCTENYDDWAKPQGFDPAEPAAEMTLSVSPAASINMADVAEDAETVNLFSATANIPADATVTSYTVVINETKTIAAEMNGAVNKAELVDIVTSLYGKRPEERKLSVAVTGTVKQGAEGFILKAQPVEVGVTLVAPVIENGYYLVGDMFTVKDESGAELVGGWSMDGMKKFAHSGKDVYEDPIFTLIFTTTADNQYWKIIPQSNVDAGNIWADGVVGTAVDGDAALEGALVNAGAQAGKIEKAAMYKMTLNMMDYTYKLEELNFGPYYYEIGNESSWSASHALYGANFDGKYVGYYYLNGEFKFKPNEGDWNYDLERNDGADNLSGNLSTEGAGNCPDPGAGFYQINLDAAAMTYQLVAANIGIVGSGVGSWDVDTNMTYNTETGAWEYTGAIEAGEIKFRMNGGWDFNWGGELDNLVHNGGNIAIAEAGTYFIQFFLSYEGNNSCTITKQ